MQLCGMKRSSTLVRNTETGIVEYWMFHQEQVATSDLDPQLMSLQPNADGSPISWVVRSFLVLPPPPHCASI